MRTFVTFSKYDFDDVGNLKDIITLDIEKVYKIDHCISYKTLYFSVGELTSYVNVHCTDVQVQWIFCSINMIPQGS